MWFCGQGEVVLKIIRKRIKVLCEQTREANKRIKIFVWIMFNISWFWKYCGWFSCLEYEEIKQQKILV